MQVELQGKKPICPETCFIAPSADLIGEVKLGEHCSVWYQAVLRADVMPIEIGNETNIQDGVIIHGTYKKALTKIGDRVTVAHGCILHGCQIDDHCLIGMKAVIMDKAHIGEESIVGAGALVLENMKFEPGSLIIGSPAKKLRSLSAEERSRLREQADRYLLYKSWYQD